MLLVCLVFFFLEVGEVGGSMEKCRTVHKTEHVCPWTYAIQYTRLPVQELTSVVVLLRNKFKCQLRLFFTTMRLPCISLACWYSGLSCDIQNMVLLLMHALISLSFFFLNQVCDILETGHLLCILGHNTVFVQFSIYVIMLTSFMARKFLK